MLKGITILDFTRLLPGPLATQMMRSLGAEVIKVESSTRPDPVRYMSARKDGPSNLFHILNDSKSLMQIDFEDKVSLEELLQEIGNAQVVIEQFRPGQMASWGLDYESLKQYNDQLIYISLTGYGTHDDKSALAGHDLNYMAYSGMLSLLKDENGKPVVPGFQLADIGGGSYMAIIACLSGIIHQLQTGEGKHITVSMTEGLNPLLTIVKDIETEGGNHRKENVLNGQLLVNYTVYECADKKWIALGALEPKFWNRFCEVVDKPEWKSTDLKMLSSKTFPKNDVETLFKSRTRDQWMTLLKPADCCAAPVLEIEELKKSGPTKSGMESPDFGIEIL